MTVGTLKIDYLKDDTNLTLNGAYPISDEDGLKSEPYTFKITNKGPNKTDEEHTPDVGDLVINKERRRNVI